MLLIGMFDSPYVRRVAISMNLLGLSFEHRNWSVGADFEKIRAYNPVGRVPALVLDNGEVLVESAAILDFVDETAGPDRALLPSRGKDRRHALQLMSIACSGVDKVVAQLYEVAFRPPERRHPQWVARCRAQSDATLQYLEERAAQSAPQQWWVGAQMSQADITVACVCTFIFESLGIDRAQFPQLASRVRRLEALPVFQKYHQPFFSPDPASGSP